MGCIVFWAKDPSPILPHLAEIDRMGCRHYFQFTLMPSLFANPSFFHSSPSFKNMSRTTGRGHKTAKHPVR
ncbi:DUF1848 family protein [Intestinimonas butyriciproducens]|uniref:DUF1848 family protein n=1 Tax=Intestinimonas butyriciproducens TaxID=1297617 RepID=UPI000E322B75|nr:DUF1848 domain-containing protein [Intestinimonas butyriciproducens]